MKKIIMAGLVSATSFLAASGVLRAASSSKSAQPKNGGQRCLIGLTSGEGIFVAGAYNAQGGWQEDEKARELFTAGTRFSVYNRRAKVGNLTTKKVEAADGVGGYYAETTAKLPNSRADRDVNSFSSESMLALSGVARPMPRLPREQSLTASLYRRAAAQLLRKKGLKLSQARLTQHWRLDLNGDKIEEVLLTAHSRDVMGKEPRANKGDYALAALRLVDRGKVRTVPLEVDAYTSDAHGGAVAAARFSLMGCYDIDGDGRMEIALSTGYYEGFGVIIFKFDGKNVAPVLSAGWGA